MGAVPKERRFDIAVQVGVAGFFIDLTVKHPLKPGTFLLGMECDGASYHSGGSAWDRDSAASGNPRQSRLEDSPNISRDPRFAEMKLRPATHADIWRPAMKNSLPVVV